MRIDDYPLVENGVINMGKAAGAWRAGTAGRLHRGGHSRLRCLVAGAGVGVAEARRRRKQLVMGCFSKAERAGECCCLDTLFSSFLLHLHCMPDAAPEGLRGPLNPSWAPTFDVGVPPAVGFNPDRTSCACPHRLSRRPMG